MNSGREYVAGTAANGHVYAVGGGNDTGWLNSVESAPINSDGSLGSWSFTSAMNHSRFLHAVVQENGYIYATGGGPDSGSLGSAEFASINSDGSLGPWQLTTPLVTPRYNHGSVAANGFLYLIGGAPYGGGVLASVEFAVINSDGSLGTWQETTPLPAAANGLAAVAVNGYIYAIGGSANMNSVQRAAINPDGSLGAWQAMSSTIIGHYQSPVVATSGYIYAVGSATDTKGNVERAAINSDGTLSAWQQVAALVVPRSIDFAAADPAGAAIYAVGGINNMTGGSALSSAEYLPAATADLAVTNAVSANPVAAGSNFAYSIGVVNNGPNDAKTVTVTDNLPATVSLVSCASAAGGVCTNNGNSVSVSYPVLANGASDTITLTVAASNTAPDNSTIANTASVQAATPDPNTANNSATSTTTLRYPADLGLQLIESQTSVSHNSSLSYIIAASDPGPYGANGVIVMDAVPAGTTFVSATPSQGTCSTPAAGSVSGTVTCSLGAIPNGGTAGVYIVVQVTSRNGAVISDTATAASSTWDPNMSNNSGTVAATVK